MDAREKIETVLGEIRSSLSEFRTIINTIPALAWSIRPDCSVDFVNKRWEEYTGLSSEQSYGEGWKAAIHPEDLPGLGPRHKADHPPAGRRADVGARGIRQGRAVLRHRSGPGAGGRVGQLEMTRPAQALAMESALL